MRTTAFAASLPLRGDTSQHENAALSHRRIRPICVAKPPPQKPGSQSSSKPMKRIERKRKNKARREGSRATESLTAVQISEKISQAVGFNLILEDVARLSKFFRSLTKSKAAAPASQELQSEVEPESNSDTQLAVRDDSPSYEPKSVTARRIVSSYVKTRGAVDRMLHVVSIRARSYSKAAARVAGDAICTVLAVGHEAFPTLRLDKAKDAVNHVLMDGWTPLGVFQWQLSPGDSKEIAARRKQRIQGVSSLLRGTRVDSFLTVTGAALTSVGKTAEKLAPIAFQRVAKGPFGYIDRKRSRKPRSHTLDSPAPSTAQRKRRSERRGAILQDGVSKRKPVSSTNEQTEILQSTFPTSKKAVDLKPKPNGVNVRTATSKPDPGTHDIRRESRVDLESGVIGTSVTGGVGESASEAASKQGAGLARGSAIVVATGAVAAAAMTVSIPTAITFSTLVVASMAFSGAKAAKASEYQVNGGLNVRQSRSLQNLEGVLTKILTTSSEKAKKVSALSTPAEQISHAQKGEVLKAVANSFEAGPKSATNTSSTTIETSAYTVSGPRPSILSTPFIGIFLRCFDSVAFQMEKLIGTLLRRSSLKQAYFRSRGEWRLLRSFQRGCEPD